MPGHMGTDIVANSLRARGLPEPEHMSDAQLEELIPGDARAALIGARMLAEGASADDLRQARADGRRLPRQGAGQRGAGGDDHPRRGAVRGVADPGRRGRQEDRRAVRAKPEAAYDYAELFGAAGTESHRGETSDG